MGYRPIKTVLWTLNLVCVVYGMYVDSTWAVLLNAIPVGLNAKEAFDY